MAILRAKDDSRTASRKPEKSISSKPAGKRLTVVLGGKTIARTTRALLYHESGHDPLYYIPRKDVKIEVLQRSDRKSYCPYKGDAVWWNVRVGDRVVADGAWSYPDIYDDYSPEIEGYIGFYGDKMDAYLIDELETATE